MVAAKQLLLTSQKVNIQEHQDGADTEVSDLKINMNSSYRCRKWGLITAAVFLLCLVSLIASEQLRGNDGTSSKGFDELKFTQLWGYTSCLQFKQQTHNQVECRYEEKPAIWSIHGIWPTQSGTSGPNFCTNVTFNPSALDPIRSQLELYWYEISAKKDPTQFWSHEWVKHGSCAMQLSQLNTEYKYFDSALLLRNKFDLYSILKDGGILPQLKEEGYKLSEISSVFKAALGVDPYLQCLELKERGKPEYHLLAVEICLDRNLNLVSCSTTSRHALLDGVMPCPVDSSKHLIQYTDKFAKSRQEEL